MAPKDENTPKMQALLDEDPDVTILPSIDANGDPDEYRSIFDE
jgi:hypothetical protein